MLLSLCEGLLRSSFRGVPRNLAACSFRAFCVSTKLSGVESLSSLNEYALSLAPTTDISTALALASKALALKKRADSKLRGRIPCSIIDRVSASALPHLSGLSTGDLTILVSCVGDNEKSMDDFLMYKLARTIAPRLTEFTSKQLSEIAFVFAKQDLDDEELLRGIGRQVAGDPEGRISILTSVFKSLSRMRIREEPLISRLQEVVKDTPRIWEKDAISLLIGFSELDIHDPELVGRLWSIVSESNQPISQDDEYFLLASYLWCPVSTPLIQKMINRAKSENRIKKRIQLLSDCIAYGLVPYHQIRGLPPKSGLRSPKRAKENWSVSSGLHLEVANALESIGVKAALEAPASSFIIDAVVSQ
jgi:hypothetical protein